MPLALKISRLSVKPDLVNSMNRVQDILLTMKTAVFESSNTASLKLVIFVSSEMRPCTFFKFYSIFKNALPYKVCFDT